MRNTCTANPRTKRFGLGLGLTARVIFAAATIMMAVFFSFVLEDVRVIKEFGLGLGVAILVEAVLIRLFLFPSVMELLGDRAWYMPAWLDRILPRVNIEGPVDASLEPRRTNPSWFRIWQIRAAAGSCANPRSVASG